jgi:hypothetical protein
MGPDTDKPSDERDVSKFIETAVLGILEVLISVFRTLYAFALWPDAVWAEARTTGTFRRHYTRPTTYAAITITSFFAVGGAILAKDASSKGWPTPFLHALTNVEPSKVLLFIFPFLLLIALYAGLVSGVARWFRGSIGFQDSLSLAFYFTGSAAFIETIFEPPLLAIVFQPHNFTPVLQIITISLFICGWVLGFRYLYCYLHLLRSLLQLSRWRTAGIWLTATGAFFLCLAIFSYISPLISGSTKALNQSLQPTAGPV